MDDPSSHDLATPDTHARRQVLRDQWPRVGDARGIEAVKWQVWIGAQLAAWRGRADNGAAMMQKTAAARSGLPQDALSRLEAGTRRVEAVELLALARAYGKSPSDIGALFEPPTAHA